MFPQLADWLESYAEALDLNVWTSSSVVSAVQDGDKWNVCICRGDGSQRTFTVNHVVFATGFGLEESVSPTYPGMVRHWTRFCSLFDNFSQDLFKGQILHANQYKNAADHIGKKVVVIGASTSGAQAGYHGSF